jgi:hypothetical protein
MPTNSEAEGSLFHHKIMFKNNFMNIRLTVGSKKIIEKSNFFPLSSILFATLWAHFASIKGPARRRAPTSRSKRPTGSARA